ncbi:MAG: M20/M25/M40 family metallo-hydrolase [Anaerolineae bacterium]|nr:M20/M25/M40 family metallo-hydrolase [Anaerolineae bacterium]
MDYNAAQVIQALDSVTDLQTAFSEKNVQQIIHDAIAIQQIPAPTFHEGPRAAYIKKQFSQYKLHNIQRDSLFNVYGRLPGSDPSAPAVLVSAHLDTVFPHGTNLSTRREDKYLFGPGLGDNSLGVAGLLALVRTLSNPKLQTKSDIWFVANSCEEGLGNLAGIRAVWDMLGEKLGAAIVLEGMALGRIYHGGIAVRRLHITCETPGGHSWTHFGQPSAIHELMKLGAKIVSIQPVTRPRTTYNIGMIEGGHSVNSLAQTASLYLDLRSEQPPFLAQLEEQIMAAIAELQQPSLKFTVDIVGDRPSGYIRVDHPLVQLASAALEAVSLKARYEIGSTDANILLANQLPTVTIGISYGGHAHRLDEFIEEKPVAKGFRQAVLLALATANHVAVW